MAAETLGSLILWLIILAIVVVVAVYLLRWLYRRSTKETACVRTGFGGEKVVVSGGAFVIPVLHAVTLVNMTVMRIVVPSIAVAYALWLLIQNIRKGLVRWRTTIKLAVPVTLFSAVGLLLFLARHLRQVD